LPEAEEQDGVGGLAEVEVEVKDGIEAAEVGTEDGDGIVTEAGAGTEVVV